MKPFFKSTLLFLSLSTAALAQHQIKPVAVEPGVSLALAQYRHSAISNIQYALDFDIPAEKSTGINANESVTFNLSAVNQPLQLDFKESAERVKTIHVNGKPIAVTLIAEHLVIEPQQLKKGKNTITIQFTAGDASLNRNDDYLYALFVPDHARTAFPCFDQPDLKARFLLTLRVPAAWKVLANGTTKDSVRKGNQTVYHFTNSDKLPTYLFSFTAGKYTAVQKLMGNRSAEFLYRETDPTKIRLSVDSVFQGHQDAINFLGQWTGIPFPFQKVGFVGIPDFQFGGMEHPGEVQYKASSLFLDEGATKDQFISRANLISHETAHMWFGDMVTMQWFNDVWMKEVFANFMADKVTEKLMGTQTFNLKFLQDHYPAAYAVDRTLGANPIRQQLDNLQEAGSMYGNIIYHKAPVMMRQLEMLMGKYNFRQGIQEYLKKYAYRNATWNDLIAILAKHTHADLYTWNKVWVNQFGRPVFDYETNATGNTITKLTIKQRAEYSPERIWPQKFHITLVYPNTSKDFVVDANQPVVEISKAHGLPKPDLIIFNSDGIGYGVFPVDERIKAHLYSIQNPLQRASVYIAAYENMLNQRSFKPDELLQLFESGLGTEQNEMNLRLLTGYLSSIYWNFTNPGTRQKVVAALEQSIWNAMQQQTAPNNKKILFSTYQSIYLTPAAKSNIYTIWQTQHAPEGIKLTEDDYTAMALSIALKSDTVTQVVRQQQERIKNPDRKKRLDFLMPALSPDVQVRDAFFTSLSQRSNRSKEAWVLSALGYLHHPLRQSTSIKYLPKSLELLEEIQQTGDIFFPQSWLSSTFGSYQSPEAAQVVKAFLDSHPKYNSKLRGKILQATDNLYRAQTLVNRD